ncbi:myocardin-related transcription factor B isoform X3 [Mus musculus]|uniref:MKL/myocardin-like 2 n=1 Tax=Mus musculus TaxID=10090 RepID=Q8R2L3_MOUSE|nr:myocardin-related transcription factor B isoform 2 [Mus musculus]XP_006522174.1 myocardin-related transcription factor B isoform X3 [Mus musculus]AAH28459.1 MKL/myocardin-like 2 [Mus musculus]|eukprot:NP_862908.1 myocardin-related transcription factor B isoform 2 [Mus musculus]
MDHTGAIDTEEELGPLAHLAPSPQSESVAHEFQELSLQSSQHLPTLNERKNGSIVFGESGLQLPLPAQSVSTGHNKKSKKPHLPLVLGSCRLHLEPARCLDG